MLITPSIATSTDTECTFSRGHLTVSRLRHSLGEDSVRAGTVVGSWAGIPAILREDDLANIMKAGPQRRLASRLPTTQWLAPWRLVT